MHGGAGNIPARLELDHRDGCARAAEAGAAVLADGGEALDAVHAAVRVLEADERFNAGRGATLDHRGLPALDAGIMRGRDLAYGAVAAVLGIQHPIDAARAVLEEGEHCLLVGPGALEFARSKGLLLTSPDRHVTEAAFATYARQKAHRERGYHRPATAEWSPDEDGDHGNTVGAVARDAHGGVAAATSTGGTLLRAPGRVGDSPIPGAGTYASNELGALSATGHGETMLRTVFAYQALLDLQRDPSSATLRSRLEAIRDRVGGTGGAIAVLPDGSFLWERTTPAMGVAFRRSGEAPGTGF